MTPKLSRAVAEHRQLVERLKEAFPDETEESLADTIEGAGSIDDAILATLRAAVEREAQVGGIKGLIETMEARMRRLAVGAERLRQIATQAMQEVGLPKITAPDMTVTVREGKGKVIVTDEFLVPDDFCRFKRTPDKTAIGDALRAGQRVLGATLGNPAPILTIRRT